MYDFKSKTRIKVKDFKSYPEDFPFRDPTCLVRSTVAMMQEFDKMQTEDANDDSYIAAQDAVSALTTAQAKAIQAASTDPLPNLRNRHWTFPYIKFRALVASCRRHVAQNLPTLTSTQS